MHPLSWLLINNRLEKVPFASVLHPSSNRLLLSNQYKGCTPSVDHSLPLPLGPALLNLWTVQWVQEHVFTVPEFYLWCRRSTFAHDITFSSNLVNFCLSVPGVKFEIYKTITKCSSLWDIDLSPINGHDIRTLRGIGKQNTTVIVTSSDIINVHAISHDYGGGDGFVVIPTNQLGTTHYVASYQPSQWDDPAFICITALHMNTSVYI